MRPTRRLSSRTVSRLEPAKPHPRAVVRPRPGAGVAAFAPAPPIADPAGAARLQCDARTASAGLQAPPLRPRDCGDLASLERFHEQFRPRATRSSGDAIQAGAELLGQKELMPNFLRLHASLAAAEMPSSYGRSASRRDGLSDAVRSTFGTPITLHADLGSLPLPSEGPADRP